MEIIYDDNNLNHSENLEKELAGVLPEFFNVDTTTKEIAAEMLDELDSFWGEKYPVVILSWRNNWEELSQYFKYAPDIRRIIYTTNTVEGVNRQLRKVTKSKGVFPSEAALMKMIFLAARDIMKKWTSCISNWALSAQQLAIHFGDRMKLDLNLGE